MLHRRKSILKFYFLTCSSTKPEVQSVQFPEEAEEFPLFATEYVAQKLNEKLRLSDLLLCKKIRQANHGGCKFLVLVYLQNAYCLPTIKRLFSPDT